MALTCQNCGHKEFLGAIFCSECGSKLIDESGVSTASLGKELRKEIDDHVQITEIKPSDEDDVPVSSLNLYFPDHDKSVPLTGKVKFTLGRISMGQQILPDIDLAEFSAFEHGVSRLHASIELSDANIFVTDLGSSNGTRINGEKLVPLRPHSVKHRDTVSLGKLHFVILTHP